MPDFAKRFEEIETRLAMISDVAKSIMEIHDPDIPGFFTLLFLVDEGLLERAERLGKDLAALEAG